MRAGWKGEMSGAGEEKKQPFFFDRKTVTVEQKKNQTKQKTKQKRSKKDPRRGNNIDFARTRHEPPLRCTKKALSHTHTHTQQRKIVWKSASAEPKIKVHSAARENFWRARGKERERERERERTTWTHSAPQCTQWDRTTFHFRSIRGRGNPNREANVKGRGGGRGRVVVRDIIFRNRHLHACMPEWVGVTYSPTHRLPG